MKIRIINTPPGQAPEDVRAAWVGLELPLAVPSAETMRIAGSGQLRRGYIVDAAQAVEILAARSPEAAKWWRENAALSIQPGKRFLFAAEVCQEVAGDDSYSCGDGRYRSDEAFAKNRSRQLTMTPQTVGQLRKYGVTDQRQLKLEYFFYTNTEEKAAALAQKLVDMGYTGRCDHAADNKKEFVVTGWTSPVKMDDKAVVDWTASMCDLGHEHDCEFDGWGTTPEQ